MKHKTIGLSLKSCRLFSGLTAGALAIGLLCGGSTVFHAQKGDMYNARLAPAPAVGVATAQVANTVGGLGSASASLSGKKLTISGRFDNMAAPATTAKLGLGIARGARGDLIFDLVVTKAAQGEPAGTNGTIAGTVDLSTAQVNALKKGQLYIMINSEKAPNGHLLGWLLK